VDDLHHDLRDRTDFDPRQTSRMKHAYHCGDLEEEVGVV